jgi:hypothetical protein
MPGADASAMRRFGGGGSGGLPPAHCIDLRAMLKCALAGFPAPVNPQSGRHYPSVTHGGKPRGRDFATL